jgi:hypothetical protein
MVLGLLEADQRRVIEIFTAIMGADLDWTPLLRLHRHADGYLSFAVAQEDDWRPVFIIGADRLERMFPGNPELSVAR